MLARGKPAGKAGTASLAGLPPGTSATIKRVGGAPELQARLAAQGLVPGAELRLVQRWPSFVVEMGHTTLAFERAVAECVYVLSVGEEGEPRASNSEVAPIAFR